MDDFAITARLTVDLCLRNAAAFAAVSLIIWLLLDGPSEKSKALCPILVVLLPFFFLCMCQRA